MNSITLHRTTSVSSLQMWQGESRSFESKATPLAINGYDCGSKGSVGEKIPRV